MHRAGPLGLRETPLKAQGSPRHRQPRPSGSARARSGLEREAWQAGKALKHEAASESMRL